MTAGIVTTVAGSALLCAPGRMGPLIGLMSRRDVRLVGALDLALAPGLMFGRPQWPWLAARAVSNVATGLFVFLRAEDGGPVRNARVFSAFLAAATLADLRTFRALALTK
ncbi:MAG TPA: hypothetical protein VGP27_15290 [Mycobacterium sp.]|nr:hypothetical protein [Mycobacterium sp.]